MMSKEQKTRMSARKDYYNNSDVLQINSTIKKAKNSSLPFLNKKQQVLYVVLSKNEIDKNFTYTLDGLSNGYRKMITDEKTSNAKVKGYQFRKSFKSNEVFSISDLKSVMQYFYIVDKRCFEYYRNDKNNYILHEVEYKKDLAILK